MFKKYMLAILIVTLILSSNIFMFAEETDPVDEFVYIINPEVGSSGKAILNDSMFISIYVQSERTLKLELIKVPVITLDEEAYFIGPYVTNDSVEEKITLSDVTTKEYIFSEYQKSGDELERVKSTLAEAQKLTAHIPVFIKQTSDAFTTDDDSSEEYILTESDLENIKFVDDLKQTVNQAQVDYNNWSEMYLKLFEETIFTNVEMVVDPSFPYFEYTVNNVGPGNYKLLIKSEEGQVIDRLDFEVVTEEIIVDEIIDDINFFDDIIDSTVFE